MTDPIIILKHETLRESLISDAMSVATAWALILPGWLLGSGAMQVTGAILFALWFVSRLIIAGDRSRMTISEARKRLDQIEAAQKGGA